MADIVRTNDPAAISAIEGILADAQISYHIGDRNISSLAGTISAIRARITVSDDSEEEARQILADAGLGSWLL